MSDDLIFGIALKSTSDGSVVADVEGTRKSVEDLKKSTEQLSGSAGVLARQNAAMNQTWLQGNAIADDARDKAWALANGYKEVGGQIVKTGGAAGKELEQVAFATARAKQEMVVLGREVAQGNFARVPGTLSIIAQGLSPVALGVAAVTVALAAGVWAWREWGDMASRASNEAKGEIEDAVAAAEKSKHLNAAEKLAAAHEAVYRQEADHNEKLTELNAARLVQSMGSHNKQLAERIMFLSVKERLAQDELDNLKRNAQDLQDAMDKTSGKPKAARADAKPVDRKFREEDDLEWFATYTGQTIAMEKAQAERFAALSQAAEDAGATDAQREQNHLDRQLASLETERMMMATNHQLSEAEVRRFEDAKLNIEKIAAAKKEQMGKAMFIQDLATLGKESAAFMTLYKVAAVMEIMAAGGVRAEKSAAWAASFGPIASAAAAAVSWAATLANAAMVSGLLGGGGGSGGGGGGNVPMPASPLPETINGPQTASAQPQSQVTIYLMGNVLTPDFVNDYVLPNVPDYLKEGINNRDFVIIDPRSRQAQMLAGA